MVRRTAVRDRSLLGAATQCDGGAVVWPLLVGPARAKEFLMRGRLVNGKEAHELGLVNHVAAADLVLDEALKMARELNALPASSYWS